MENAAPAPPASARRRESPDRTGLLPALGLLARLVVGSVWIVAGALKLPHLESSVTAVRGYQLLPADYAEIVGYTLPFLEVVVGACLVLGVCTRTAGAVSALLQVAFIVGIASVWARGISINCGCFGDGGPAEDAIGQYPWDIARDTGLLAASLLVVWLRRTPLALANLLTYPYSKEADVDDEP